MALRMLPLGRKASFFVRLVLVAVVYAIIAKTVNLSKIAEHVTPSLAYAFAGAVALTLIQAAICTYRWTIVARATSNVPGLRASFMAYMEGLFVNQVLPSVVGGDALRAIRWCEHGVSPAEAVVSVLGDRVFGLLGAASLALVAVAQLSSMEVSIYWMSLAWVLASGAFLCCLLFFAIASSDLLSKFLRRSKRLAGLVTKVTSVDLGRTDFVVCTSLSIAGQALAGISVVLIARDIGIQTSASILVTVTALIVLMSMIPVSLAGWGVREAGFLAILAPLGVSGEKAVLLGVLFGLQGLFASLVGGVSLLLQQASPPPPRDTQ